MSTIGILILSHDAIGRALVNGAKHIFGEKPKRLVAMSIAKDDDPDLKLKQAQRWIHRLDQGSGVIVLTDLYGATPANIATRLLQPGQVEIVAGVNLPMLVRVLTYRKESLFTVIEKAVSGGKEGVFSINSGRKHG